MLKDPERVDKELEVSEVWLFKLLEHFYYLKKVYQNSGFGTVKPAFAAMHQTVLSVAGDLYVRIRTTLGEKGQLQDVFYRGVSGAKEQQPTEDKMHVVTDRWLEEVMNELRRLEVQMPVDNGKPTRWREVITDNYQTIKGWLEKSGRIERQYQNI